jgi:tetratricopeptide (TPR) repeat protein
VGRPHLAVGAELIYRRGTRPDAEYTFKHALVQDAAYSTLLLGRRQQLHARIAATLEDRFPEIAAAQPALLAHHCEEAGLSEKAVGYWLAAGRQAWGCSAVAEAVALLQRGLALVPGLPDTDRRRETELDLRIALGQAIIASRGWGAPELDEVHSRARELALVLNRPRALLSILYGQFFDHWARADLRRAQRLAAELRELGDATGDVPMQVTGWDAGGFACFHLGEFSAGRAYLEKGLALYDPAHRALYAELLSHDMLVFVRAHSFWLLACLGHLDQAQFQRHAFLDEARRLSHPFTLATALGAAAWGAESFVRLTPASLLQYDDECLALATEHGLAMIRLWVLIHRGWCLAALGRAEEGIALIAAGLAGWDEIGFKAAVRPWLLTYLADACRIGGDLERGLAHLLEARRNAVQTQQLMYQGETLRLTGDVLLAMGDPAAAEASYLDALALARQQSAKLWELRTATRLARLWNDQGKRTEARDLLAPVYNWFSEGFDTPVLKEAKALLHDLD